MWQVTSIIFGGYSGYNSLFSWNLGHGYVFTGNFVTLQGFSRYLSIYIYIASKRMKENDEYWWKSWIRKRREDESGNVFPGFSN